MSMRSAWDTCELVSFVQATFVLFEFAFYPDFHALSLHLITQLLKVFAGGQHRLGETAGCGAAQYGDMWGILLD